MASVNTAYFKTSIPSDRYYDDLDLSFTFLDKKDECKDCFYISLDSNSPQKIVKEIYSARIKPPRNSISPYKDIKLFLQRVIDIKRQDVHFDTGFSFTGNGYYSNDLEAWSNNLITLKIKGDIEKTISADKDGSYSFLDLNVGNYIIVPYLEGTTIHPDTLKFHQLSDNKFMSCLFICIFINEYHKI